MIGARPYDTISLMAGESASSFVLRLANFLTVKPERFLKSVLGDPRDLASAVHRYDMVELLRDASGIDPVALSAAFVRRCGGLDGLTVLDFKVAEHHLDQSARRVSPVALARDIEAGRPPYHRLPWSIRDLRLDPLTGSPLISNCDHCHRSLTWDNCVDPASCGRCGRPLWRAKASLDPTPYDLFLCDLFHPDPGVRANRRNRLAPPLASWSEGDLMDLVLTLRRVQRLVGPVPTQQNTAPAGPETIETTSSISGMLALPMRAAAQRGARTSVIVAAAATTSALRAAPRPVAEFLTSLLMSRA